MTMTERPAVLLDHLAIGVHWWSDTYERFIGTLGGQWVRGGKAGNFDPYQLSYGDCMYLEFIAPGSVDGFMRRFLERNGPAPHHVTFKVASMPATLETLGRNGFETFRGRPDGPTWREAFVHPKESGIGTLVQIVESDDVALEQSRGSGRPADLPVSPTTDRALALFGLTVADLPRARALLVGALHGTVTEEGANWQLVTWGPGRSILLRHRTVTPGGEDLWREARPAGVGFVVFGPRHLNVAALEAHPAGLVRMPPHEQTGIPVWLW